ncbi:MAG: hypothetical protein U1F37_21420 [Alphaproteobacteria bacterium]
MSKIKRISSPAVTEPPPGLDELLVVDGIALHFRHDVAAARDFGTVEDVGAYEQAKIIFAKIRDLLRGRMARWPTW